MNEQLKNMTLALLDAGCGQDAIEKAGRLLETAKNRAERPAPVASAPEESKPEPRRTGLFGRGK